MPVISEMQRFRKHTRTGKRGQTWTTYFWDGRTAGIKDVPLGSDYDAAVELWRQCEVKYSAAMAEAQWERNASLALATTQESVACMRLLFGATDLRPGPGIYFLIEASGRVSYVGQSESVLFRLSGHTDKTFASARMVSAPDPAERLRLEAVFIRLLRPPLNIVHVVPEEQAA